MPAVNYVIYGCSSSKTTSGVITIQELPTERKAFLQLLLKMGDKWQLSYSRKRPDKGGGGWGHFFFENPRGIFRFFTLPLEIPDKTRLHFWDVVLVSDYHGSKGEAIKLIPYYMIDIIYKTVKPSHLKKLQIIQNIKNLYFPVKNIFSDWILKKQIIVKS